jgi:hypothetical protein
LPDKVYKERKAGQGIIVYGWCPAKNKAIALQVDENGRLVIDPEDLDTRYLKLDGSNSPMTGNLDIGAKELQTTLCYMKENPANSFEFGKRAGGLASMYASNLLFQYVDAKCYTR